jgi:hypothetical protein
VMDIRSQHNEAKVGDCCAWSELFLICCQA